MMELILLAYVLVQLKVPAVLWVVYGLACVGYAARSVISVITHAKWVEEHC